MRNVLAEEIASTRIVAAAVTGGSHSDSWHKLEMREFCRRDGGSYNSGGSYSGGGSCNPESFRGYNG